MFQSLIQKSTGTGYNYIQEKCIIEEASLHNPNDKIHSSVKEVYVSKFIIVFIYEYHDLSCRNQSIHPETMEIPS
jgi:hypothetical protein